MDEAQDFVQGITVPGGVVMSPIEVISRPLTVKELQEDFYDSRNRLALRRGPASTDEERLSATISYDLPPAGFPFPVSLVSPPLVLQKRIAKAASCTYALGNEYNLKVWEEIVNKTCAPPFECPNSLLQNSSDLMTCLSSETPSHFFGKKSFPRKGKVVFAEFLQSIADSSVLVRDGNAQFSDAFVDAQTESVEVIMIGYAPQYGAVSTISIFADFSTDITMNFQVQHYLSVEDEDLATYTGVAICAFILATLVLIDLIFLHLEHFSDEDYSNQAAIFDMLVQVIMPVVYFAVRLFQLSSSRDSILETVGNDGLKGVPWASQQVTLERKLEDFFDNLKKFDDKNQLESTMKTIYFVFSMLTLCRFIMQVRTHRRASAYFFICAFVGACPVV